MPYRVEIYWPCSWLPVAEGFADVSTARQQVEAWVREMAGAGSPHYCKDAESRLRNRFRVGHYKLPEIRQMMDDQRFQAEEQAKLSDEMDQAEADLGEAPCKPGDDGLCKTHPACERTTKHVIDLRCELAQVKSRLRVAYRLIGSLLVKLAIRDICDDEAAAENPDGQDRPPDSPCPLGP